MTAENPEKPVNPQEQEESNRPVKVELDGLVNWFKDEKGRLEKGADYLRKLGECYTSELADQVIETITKNFTLDKIVTVLERMQQLDCHHFPSE
jgi:hypothetical protein